MHRHTWSLPIVISLLLLASISFAQTITSLSPSSVSGAKTFTLTVNGTNFVSGSIIKWNGTNMTTTFVSSTQLTASINKYYTTLASYPGTVAITVLNLVGGRSSSATLTITQPVVLPAISSLSPSSVQGAKTFTLTVNGSNFVSGSIIKWNGTNMTTAFVSSTQISASINKYYTTLASYPGTAAISVLNPDGGRSSSATLTITQAVTLPAISALSPSSILGAKTFILTVNGSNFVSGSIIKWNGTNMTTAFVSSTQLTASINKYYTTLASYPGTATVSVLNPNGGRSAGASIVISDGNTIPYPVATHPRLWITQNDLTRLRSWAVSTNPVYAQGMAVLLNQVVYDYNTYFFPGGHAANPFPDPGDTQGYGTLPDGATSNVEDHAIILAFNSLIDPDPNKRILYAQYARNLLMVAMNQAALGHASDTPFRDPAFSVYNRGNGSVFQYPLIVDWIYSAKDGNGNSILTAADKATIRNAFLIWANDCIHASTAYGDHPEPIGVTNSLQLLPNNLPYRMASNNYYLGHARLLTLMALSIDPADDPAVNSSGSLSDLGNTLRSYIPNATGAWLYQEYAMMGDAQATANAFGISGSGAGFGLASGGLPPEGMLYGHSYGFILEQLLALQTAGFNNPTYTGPQVNLIGAPVWDRFVTGFLSSMVPASKTFASESYLGPVYQLASYGDLLRTWVTPDFVQPFTMLTLMDYYNNKTSNVNAVRWFAINALEGGSASFYNRMNSSWSYGSISTICYFMLFDPAASAPTDPRPSLPTVFVDKPAGRIVAHSGWSSAATMFDYRASWNSIYHQVNDAGQFELYRNGEWLTKEMSNYDNNMVGLTSLYHNTLTLQNWCANGTPNLGWYEGGEWANGSQWMLDTNAGDPVNQISYGTGYVYAASDLTKLYNRPDFWTPANGAVDISQATRSILWLNNDYIVVYDRATSVHSGLFKRFNLSLVTQPVISGNLSTETLSSGQRLYIQTLLPSSPTITYINGAANLNPVAELEPTQYVMSVEDASKPSNTRFLHVLQGANSGVAVTAATRLQSTAGTAFDGTAFGSAAVFFPVNTGSITTTTLVVPSSVHTVYVTGLSANTNYSVGTGNGTNSVTITIGTGSGTSSDAAGLLRISI